MGLASWCCVKGANDFPTNTAEPELSFLNQKHAITNVRASPQAPHYKATYWFKYAKCSRLSIEIPAIFFQETSSSRSSSDGGTTDPRAAFLQGEKPTPASFILEECCGDQEACQTGRRSRCLWLSELSSTRVLWGGPDTFTKKVRFHMQLRTQN